MQVFAQDLINQNSSSSSSVSSNVISSSNDILQTVSQSGINFDITILDTIITNLNIFVLAWSIFYSYPFLIQFFQYRIIGAKGKVSDEIDGMAGIYPLLKMWWRYMGCLAILIVYGFTRSTELGLPIGIVTILVFLIKLFIDFMNILGLFSYFPWSKNLAKNIKKRFKWKS